MNKIKVGEIVNFIDMFMMIRNDAKIVEFADYNGSIKVILKRNKEYTLAHVYPVVKNKEIVLEIRSTSWFDSIKRLKKYWADKGPKVIIKNYEN